MDTDGWLLDILVHASDIQDADGLGDLLQRVKPLYNWLRSVFAHSIYSWLATLLAFSIFRLALTIVRCPAGSTAFVVQPRLRVVERFFGWISRKLQLSKDNKALPKVFEAMITLAAIRLLIHRLSHTDFRRLSAT